jgi:hypothetical protein
LGFRVSDFGFQVSGFGLSFQVSSCRVWVLGCRVQAVGFRAVGFKFKAVGCNGTLPESTFHFLTVPSADAENSTCKEIPTGIRIKRYPQECK